MSKTTKTIFVDDMTGLEIEDGGGTVRFAFEGINYEIDLSVSSKQGFQAALEPFVAAARQTTPMRQGSVTRKSETASVRDWLRRNGHEVSDRGRIPNFLLELHAAAG